MIIHQREDGSAIEEMERIEGAVEKEARGEKDGGEQKPPEDS